MTEGPHRWRLLALDLALAVGAGVAFAAVAAFYLADFHWAAESFSHGFSATNFRDYCAGIVALREGVTDWFPPRRARAGGLLPSLFLEEVGGRGVLDALAWGALVSGGALGSSLYLWARALHGRLAGGLAVLLALSLSPLVLVTRLFSYYPEITALCCLAAATGALALRSRSLLALVLASAVAGLVLLVDVRGVVWAGFDYLLLGVVALRLGTWPRRLAGVGVILLSLWGSYQAGSWSYDDQAHSLEVQACVEEIQSLRLGTKDKSPSGRNLGGSFVWGRSAPARWPATVAYLLEQSQFRPEAEGRLEADDLALVQQVEVLWPATLFAGLTTLVALRRRPWLLLGLVLGTAPFVLALNGIYATAELRVRFLTQVLPPLAVWGGVGLAGVLTEIWSRVPVPQRARVVGSPVAGLGLLGVVLLLVLGVIPSPLSPVAPWRTPWSEGNTHVLKVLQSVRGGPPPGDHCGYRMAQEVAAGEEAFRSAWYGREAVR